MESDYENRIRRLEQQLARLMYLLEQAKAQQLQQAQQQTQILGQTAQ